MNVEERKNLDICVCKYNRLFALPNQLANQFGHLFSLWIISKFTQIPLPINREILYHFKSFKKGEKPHFSFLS